MNFPEVPGVGFWCTDFATGKAYWSDELYRLHGLPPDVEAAVDLFMKYVHIDDQDQVDEELHRGTRTLKPFSFFYKITAADNCLRRLFVMGAFDFNATGNPAYRYGITLDLTGLPEHKTKEAKEQLQNFTMPAMTTLFDPNLCQPFVDALKRVAGRR